MSSNEPKWTLIISNEPKQAWAYMTLNELKKNLIKSLPVMNISVRQDKKRHNKRQKYWQKSVAVTQFHTVYRPLPLTLLDPILGGFS